MDAATVAPLSFVQQGLLRSAAARPSRAVANVNLAYRLYGPLDVGALGGALQTIIRRHRILRTTFTDVDGTLRQTIAPELELRLPVCDLSRGAPGLRVAQTEQLLDAACARAFDLGRGPLIRTVLVRWATNEHILLVSAHPAIFDRDSIAPFNRELEAHYAALHAGIPANGVEPPLQYADVARAERAAADGYAAAQERAYWRAAVHGTAFTLDLPIDPARSTLPFAGASACATIVPLDVARRIAALGRQHGATIYVTLLAAFDALLFRYTGQTDFVVGRPVPRDAQRGYDGLIGPFEEVLPLRARLDGTTTFERLLRATRAAVLAADEHRALPFALSACALRDDHADEIAAPNVVFSAEAHTDDAPHLATLDVEPYRPHESPPAAALGIGFAQTAAGLELRAHYDGGIFADASIERMLANFVQLAESIVAAPDAPLGELALLSQAERDVQAVEWNPEPVRARDEPLLSESFERCADRRPDAVAIADGVTTLSYRALNARANQLARALRARGIGSEDIVAIATERSIWTIVSMLAVIKAGAAYLPLDPSYPPERLRTMVADTHARLVLSRGTDARRDGLAPAERCLDVEALDLAAFADTDLPAVGTADALAYVMFTSGSTGRAKGVLVTHRAIANLVAAPALAIGADDVVAQLSNVSFDGATYEIWGALLAGARLELIERETMLSSRALAACLRERRISVAFLTSALLRHVAREQPAAFATLRCLIAGGEVMDPAAVRAIFAHGAPPIVLNGYGPSETTTFATTYAVAAPPLSAIPIGKPLPNVQAYILDERANAVPIGVRGQLYIGGLGVARGYLNDPELTARKFVAHPFAPRSGARVYATGDLARFLPDGNIEYLGRIDRQIKIRGYRVETDDIEAALKSLPGVSEAVVLSVARSEADAVLAAFVVARDAAARATEGVRAALAERLPEYMLPQMIVLVPSIPLTANGKIDVPALEAVLAERRQARASDETAGDAPPHEREVARIFADVLGIAHVEGDANFFELGGHSLLAAQALARIGERFAVELALRDFFAGPTAAAIARALAGAPARSRRPVRATLDASTATLSDAQIDALLDEALRE